MKQASKSFSLFLSLFLILSPLTPNLGRVFADEAEQPALTLSPGGEPVAVVSAVQSPSLSSEVPQSAPSVSSTAEFLTGDNPLSPVDEAKEDAIVSIESNDPFYSTSGSWGQSYDDLWWLKRVRADQAWAYSTGVGTKVAVIDTGVDYNHEDMAGKIWTNPKEIPGNGIDDDGNGLIDDVNGWDYVNNDNNPIDDNDHGTMVAGIIGASTNNGLGIASIAPDSRIIPIKVLNAQGSGFVSDVIKAIRYAADLAADVINLSLGVFKSFLSKSLQNAFQSAVAYAKSKGSIVVAAAGNDGSRVENDYPAGIPDVIAVGAIEPVTDNRAYFSNFGKLLDFVAPGVDILSLNAAGGQNFGGSSGNPNYQRASGTSFSSPIVAGVVALLRGLNHSFTYDQIYQRLRNSATDLGAPGFDIYYGYGLVNALGAMTVASVSGASVSSSTSPSDSSTSSGSSSRSWRKSLEDSMETPFFGPSPAPIGNWYFIEAFSSGLRPAKRKKKEDVENYSLRPFSLKFLS